MVIEQTLEFITLVKENKPIPDKLIQELYDNDNNNILPFVNVLITLENNWDYDYLYNIIQQISTLLNINFNNEELNILASYIIQINKRNLARYTQACLAQVDNDLLRSIQQEMQEILLYYLMDNNIDNPSLFRRLCVLHFEPRNNYKLQLKEQGYGIFKQNRISGRNQ